MKTETKLQETLTTANTFFAKMGRKVSSIETEKGFKLFFESPRESRVKFDALVAFGKTMDATVDEVRTLAATKHTTYLVVEYAKNERPDMTFYNQQVNSRYE